MGGGQGGFGGAGFPAPNNYGGGGAFNNFNAQGGTGFRQSNNFNYGNYGGNRGLVCVF